MAGHSKWKQIKHKKAATDAKKSKTFTKLVKIISIAVKEKGEDPNTNPTLRSAIQQAREANMPKENIDRAIKKASTERLEELLIEAYGPHGVAVMIEAITDSKNRTIHEIKHLLRTIGGNMAEPGSVAWMFDKKDREFIPKFPMTLTPEQEEEIMRFFQAIDDNDDVQELYSNVQYLEY